MVWNWCDNMHWFMCVKEREKQECACMSFALFLVCYTVLFTHALLPKYLPVMGSVNASQISNSAKENFQYLTIRHVKRSWHNIGKCIRMQKFGHPCLQCPITNPFIQVRIAVGLEPTLNHWVQGRNLTVHCRVPHKAFIHKLAIGWNLAQPIYLVSVFLGAWRKSAQHRDINQTCTTCNPTPTVPSLFQWIVKIKIKKGFSPQQI